MSNTSHANCYPSLESVRIRDMNEELSVSLTQFKEEASKLLGIITRYLFCRKPAPDEEMNFQLYSESLVYNM